MTLEQVTREDPGGPKSVVCDVFNRETGQQITRVIGHKTYKTTAKANARQRALKIAKKKLNRKWKEGELEFRYS